MKHILSAIFVFGLASLYSTVAAQVPSNQPVELGNVQWMRDLDAAVAASRRQQQPIAILFQEVPG